MTAKKTSNDKTKKPQRKNSYRLRYTLPDGRRVEYTSHTKEERDKVEGHVPKLISAKRVGTSALESEEWALRLPNGILRDCLTRWGLIPDTRERTLADLYQTFITNGKGRERTLINRRAAADRLSVFFGAGCLLRDISRERAGDFITYLETKGNTRTGGGLKPNSVATIVKYCKKFFQYAREEGWIKTDPFSRFTAAYKPVPDRMQNISQADTIRVIEATPNKEHKVIIALVRFCGLRGASELYNLTFDASCYHPSTADRPAELLVSNTKTQHHKGREKPRPVPLTPYVERLIQDLWESIPEGENRFFPGMKKTSNPGVIVKKAFKRNGIDLGRMYNLRDSFDNDVMEGGMYELDPKMAEVITGHDIKTSLRNYQIVSDSRKRKAADKFMEIMSAPPISPPPAPTFDPGNYPHVDEVSGDKNAQTLENKALSQKESPSCILLQQGYLPGEGVFTPSQDPQKQGLSAITDNDRPHFCPHQDFIEQIADLFDRLEAAEQEQLIQRLTARLKTTV